ncbi:hypothetical protein D3C72_2386450 [compost metagenome]
MIILTGITDAFDLSVGGSFSGFDPKDAARSKSCRGQKVAQWLGERRLAHEYESLARHIRKVLTQPIQQFHVAKAILGEDGHLQP